MTRKILEKIKKDYATIAKDFDKTRQNPWPEFEEFLKYSKKSSTKIKLLDAGCGNGRLLNFLEARSLTYVGVDNNRELLKLAKKNHPKAKFKYGDILKLPFPTSTFDSVWCIAVLHHLPTPKMRLAALRELKRVTKKGGIIALTVWNLWQPKYKKYIDPKNHNSLIPWGEEKKILRYYYAFKENELKKLIASIGFTKVKKIKSDRNFAYIMEK